MQGAYKFIYVEMKIRKHAYIKNFGSVFKVLFATRREEKGETRERNRRRKQQERRREPRLKGKKNRGGERARRTGPCNQHKGSGQGKQKRRQERQKERQKKSPTL